VRDAVIPEKLMASGEVDFDEQTGEMKGWVRDPYDESMIQAMTMNRSEAREYDALFPEHPLSRAREVLRHLQEAVRVADEVKQEPRFQYEQAEEGRKPWWKVW
jgi:hypothetical protein